MIGMKPSSPSGLTLPFAEALLRSTHVRTLAFRLLAVICALHVSGAHWVALQTVAWTGMLVSRSQESSVQQAVETTFDGEHPCALCHVVEEGQKQQRETETVPLVEHLAKLSFLRPQGVALPLPSEASVDYRGMIESGGLRAETPPTPPPRLA